MFLGAQEEDPDNNSKRRRADVPAFDTDAALRTAYMTSVIGADAAR